MTQSYTNWIERFWSYLAVPIFANTKREEAIALRDKQKPSSLFRYRALNKERGFETVEHEQVWLSQPVAANDPYDSSFTLSHAHFVWPERAYAKNIARFAPLAQDKL